MFSSEEADVLFHLGRCNKELEWLILYAQLGFCPDICSTVRAHLSLFSKLLAVSQEPRAPFLLVSHWLKTCCNCPDSDTSRTAFFAAHSKARTHLGQLKDFVLE